MLAVFRRIGENHRRTVDGEDTHAVVCDERCVVVDERVDSILKIDKNLMGQLTLKVKSYIVFIACVRVSCEKLKE